MIVAESRVSLMIHKADAQNASDRGTKVALSIQGDSRAWRLDELREECRAMTARSSGSSLHIRDP